jgi:hypothetical protein
MPNTFHLNPLAHEPSAPDKDTVMHLGTGSRTEQPAATEYYRQLKERHRNLQ